MKNSFLKKAFVCLFTVVALCSCNKDDDDDQPTSTLADNTITAIVENGSSYNDKIDSVKAVIENDDYEKELASSAYSNGGFTLKLPETVSDALYTLGDDVPDGVTVSNPNVKVGYLETIDAYKLGEHVGYFSQSTSSEDWWAWYMYSNGDVSITGTQTETYDAYTLELNWNVHLKKGWNIVYEHDETLTTQKPSVTLKWYAEVWGSSSSSVQGVRAKKVPSLFSKSKIRL